MEQPTQVAGFDPIAGGRFWVIGDTQEEGLERGGGCLHRGPLWRAGRQRHALVVRKNVGAATQGRPPWSWDPSAAGNDRRDGCRFTSAILRWIYLRTTTAIESSRHRSAAHQGDQGTRSRSAGLAMAYKPLEAAQARWCCVNASHLVALVRAGATFVNRIKVEREDQRSAA